MAQIHLRRSLTLPWLVFYGVGVTVGAGIFALIGEVLALSGDHAMYAFLVAGLVAGITGFSYVLLASVFPKAAGKRFSSSMAWGCRPHDHWLSGGGCGHHFGGCHRTGFRPLYGSHPAIFSKPISSASLLP